MNLQDKITIASLTDVGKLRSKNEDAVGYDSAMGIVVLADGMGGHRGGEIASNLAIDTIISELQKSLESPKDANDDEINGFSPESICIQDAILTANELVYNAAESNIEHRGMGTTVVVLHFYNNTLSLAHIGDSRCYRMRKNQLEQLSKDHSLLQELVDRGFYTPEEARRSGNKNLVTRALGIDPVVMPDIQEDIVLKNDIYLLCSDGLSDLVDDDDICLTLREFSANLEEAAKQLITKANDKGGTDNISVMLCRIDKDFSSKQKWFKKFVSWFD